MDYADLKLDLFVDKKLFIEHTATTAKHKIYRYELERGRHAKTRVVYHFNGNSGDSIRNWNKHISTAQPELFRNERFV